VHDVHEKPHLQIDAFKDVYGERKKFSTLRIFEDDEED